MDHCFGRLVNRHNKYIDTEQMVQFATNRYCPKRRENQAKQGGRLSAYHPLHRKCLEIPCQTIHAPCPCNQSSEKIEKSCSNMVYAITPSPCKRPREDGKEPFCTAI